MKAWVLYTCISCGKYPVKILEKPGEKKHCVCPNCGSDQLIYEKAYAADDKGTIIE